MSNTKTELLHEASKIFLKKGFHGLTLQNLADSLKIRKASLFHHVNSKKQLGIELLKFYQDSFVAWTVKHEGMAPKKQIIAYADELTRWICEKKRVCPVGAMTLDFDNVEVEIQEELKKLHYLQRDWLTKQFKEIKKSEELRVPVPAAMEMTISLLQGSIQTARMLDKPEIVKQNLNHFLKGIL